MANIEPTGNGANVCAETNFLHVAGIEPTITNGQLTVFTSTKPAHLGKVVSFVKGELQKGVAAHMSEGRYEVKTFDSKQALAQLLRTVGTNQAICASLPRTDELTGRILTKERAPKAGCLARTKVDFLFKRCRGVLILDYDPEQFEQVLTAFDLWAKLIQIAPTAGRAGAVAWCSGSSHIHGPDGELQGLKGQRLYILVDDASDIPRAGKNLAARCWLAGLGRIKISVSGHLLPRTLWDEAMHEAARLDFIGGAICTPPLSQQRGVPILMGGDDWLDTRLALPDLTESELADVARFKGNARAAAQPAAAAQRARWIAERVVKEAARLVSEQWLAPDAADASARRMYEAALDHTLYGDYRIPLSNGKFVTVAEVLNNPQKWNGVKTLDPLEPEHRNFEECGMLFLSGSSQNLFSFAHGGVTYRLSRQPRRVEYRHGDQSAVADDLAKALCCHGDIFWSGGRRKDLVRAYDGGFDLLEKADAQYLLGHRAALFKTVKDVATPMNIPGDHVGLVMAALGQGSEQSPQILEAVTSLPYATAARRLVMQPGFDAETGVFNTMQCAAREIPDVVSRQDVIDALKCIWAPWSEYKFADDASRGAMLAAIFTTVLRPALSTAPGVFFDAPVQNSGKTKAALVLGALMTGDYVGVYSFVAGAAQEAEYAKSILAMLRGPRRFWLIDNVTGQFESAVLGGLITSGRVQGRILGLTKDADFGGRVMIVDTGNNAQLGPDLRRRYLTPRIDTGVERPGTLPHTFEPATVAKEARMDIATAVLTVLAYYWQAPPVVITDGSDYAEWTELVRVPVVFLQREGLTEAAGIGPVDDPVMTYGEAVVSAGDLGHSQFLRGALLHFGAKPFFARDVCIAIATGWSAPKLTEGAELMREGLENILPGRDLINKVIGPTLSHKREQRRDGLRLVSAGAHKDRGAAWRVCGDGG